MTSSAHASRSWPAAESASRLDRRQQLAWRRHLARRLHSAPSRAIGLLGWAAPQGSWALVFDGVAIEVASAAREPSWFEGLPRGGQLQPEGELPCWRFRTGEGESQRWWRQLGGDEAFAVPLPSSPWTVAPSDAPQLCGLVRRGEEFCRVVMPEVPALRDLRHRPHVLWLQRFLPWLRPDLARLVLT